MFAFHNASFVFTFKLINPNKKMKVQVNDKEVEVSPSFTLQQLIPYLDLPTQGIAVAVNNRMIPRTDRESHALHENDRIVIIKAACGG